MLYTIIGAGIGGLTTALAFEKNGIDYQIFEQTPDLLEVGAGIWLAPNALQVLDHIGVLEEVQQKGNTINRITLGKADLSPLSDNYQDTIEKIFGFTTIAIHRAKLQKLLFDKIPTSKIHLGKGFNKYEELENGKIKVVFDDGHTVETDYLIGADGIHSKVRKQLFPTSNTRYSGQTCWRGIAELALDEEFHHRGMELWGNQIRFGISRISENKVYWFAVAIDKPNEKDQNQETHNKLLTMFQDFHPMVTNLISATPKEKIMRNDISDLKPLEVWHKNNILLIGDAGHATTPNMGQGGAQAIEDAYYLSELLKQESTKNIFEIFQQKREKKVHQIVKQSWNTGKMAHWKYGKGIRNFLLKNAPKKMIEKQMLTMYQIDKTVSIH
ncbi:FAD-dependent monooxygenase [Aquimarina litoralis]|uniref:FAD-dependent monooxygenase n=1 Tax=Aquimarina litoralis TaxID=584605 RepID=UPI001C59AB38|nr:FAD-dependent monooxygenase [Aquimarina litoralis]MBW1296982.1 zeaxanthin epoxidase [Aquimarina litoralis]